MAILAKQALQEREIEVDRQDLIKILQKNREDHIKTYKEALAGYKEAAAKKLKSDGEDARRALEKNLARVAGEIEEFNPDDPARFGDHFVLIQQVVMTLPVPRCYADAYDAALAIANWDVNKTLKLSFGEFNCFVRDKWNWMEEFKTISERYAAKKI